MHLVSETDDPKQALIELAQWFEAGYYVAATVFREDNGHKGYKIWASSKTHTKTM